MIDPEPWVTRSHPGPRATPFPLTTAQRAAVEAAIRPATTETRVFRRAQALLLMADGVSVKETAMLVGAHERTVYEWRVRFRDADDPAAMLTDAPRSGRPVSLFLPSTPQR
jgi:hypothetical protein